MKSSDFRLQTSDFRKAFFYCSLWSVVCGLTMGCVHRTLTVHSEPEGASLILNDQNMGPTPYTGPFEWYGWYRIRIEKEGFHRLDDRAFVRAPIYLWIPLDFLMELLPVTIRDDQVFSYQLIPKEPLPEPSPPVIDVPGDSPTPASTP